MVGFAGQAGAETQEWLVHQVDREMKKDHLPPPKRVVDVVYM